MYIHCFLLEIIIINFLVKLTRNQSCLSTYNKRLSMSVAQIHKKRLKMSTAIANNREDRIVWVDCEMTGLDAKKDRTIEVACVVTESDLTPVDEGFQVIINQPKSLLDGMVEWCREHHGTSGLTKLVLESKIGPEKAQDMLLDYVKKHVVQNKSCLAGNSVHCDRVFLMNEFPKFIDYLHYRIIDVSTVKVLAKTWRPELYESAPAKKGNHRALDDIRESIQELKHYRDVLFFS